MSTFSEFIDQSYFYNEGSLQENLNLQIHGLTRNLDDTDYCYVDVNFNDFITGESEICEYNTDGFISNNTDSIPLLPSTKVAIYIAPDTRSCRLKRLDHGWYLNDNGDRININDSTHVRFCSLQDSNCQVFVVFPFLDNTEQKFMSLELQTIFINNIFLPSLEKVCSKNRSIYNRFPRSIEEVLSSCGLTSFSAFFLPASILSDVVKQIRCEIGRNEELDLYRDFFFKTVAFGYKEPLTKDQDQLVPPLVHPLDFSKLDPSTCYIDVAINAEFMQDEGRRNPIFSWKGKA